MACKITSRSLAFAAAEVVNDEGFVRKAVMATDGRALHFAAEPIQLNQNFILSILRETNGTQFTPSITSHQIQAAISIPNL